MQRYAAILASANGASPYLSGELFKGDVVKTSGAKVD
jgi:hypothetical protein